MLFRSLRRFKSDVFKSLDKHIPWNPPLSPIAPQRTGFLHDNHTFRNVKGRQIFLSPLFAAINAKLKYMKLYKELNSWTPKDLNRILLVTGEHGTGKTAALGLIGDLIRSVDNKDDFEDVRSYVADAVPADHVDETVNNLKDFIFIPIRFEGRQKWTADEMGRESIMAVFSRIVQSIIMNYGQNIDRSIIMEDLQNETVSPATVIKYLKEQFGKKRFTYIYSRRLYGH